ncbi:MAG: hypothetical protein DI539_26705 [Flavobacterium psychrophilum]|jgi:hypothetical protein|nr:MAG: hypothetical protein DI539_26705 [Flavobacterium psychrophilum]
MENEIVNRVNQSQLVTFDLEELYTPGERVLLDIKDQLFQGMILKEKDFRDFIKATDWSVYKNKFVAITCSVDAIIPTWAFMLLTIALQSHASKIVFGNIDDLENQIFHDTLSTIDYETYRDAKIVIKGCSKVHVPVAVYVEATNKLKPFAASIMFGEPCSTVPLYKKPKQL